MAGTEFIALLLALTGPALLLFGMLRLPATLAMFGAGLGSAFLPGLPRIGPSAEVFTLLFLPPIIYAASVRASVPLLRHTLLSGVAAGLAVTVMTIAAVAIAALLLVPQFGLVAALLTGTILAVFDTRLFHEADGRPHVPRALADALKTREMVARAVAVTLFGLLVEQAGRAQPDWIGLAGGLAAGLVGGAALGAGLGIVMVWLRERSGPAPVEILVSVATPYLGALGARWLGLPPVVVVMAAALAVSTVRVDRRTGAARSSAEARLTAIAFWEQASLLLSAVLFFLTGRALPGALQALDDRPGWWLALVTLVLLGVVMSMQAGTSWIAARLPALWRAHGGAPAVATGVQTWASSRSVVGLILALSIPATRPDGEAFAPRDLLLAVATLAVIASIVLQGVSLRWTVRKADLGDDKERQDEERCARAAMDAASREVCRREDPSPGFAAERQVLLDLRRTNRIGDEVLRAMLRDVDLRARLAEDGSLPGAGPPNP